MQSCGLSQCRHILKLCERVSQQIIHGRLTSVPDMMLDVSHINV